MTNVQIAIQDIRYAEELRQLLEADGSHRVHLVHRPSSAVDGIIVVDVRFVVDVTALNASDVSRCVVFSRNGTSEWQTLITAGVKYLINGDCSPALGRLVVLAAEFRLKAGCGTF